MFTLPIDSTMLFEEFDLNDDAVFYVDKGFSYIVKFKNNEEAVACMLAGKADSDLIEVNYCRLYDSLAVANRTECLSENCFRVAGLMVYERVYRLPDNTIILVHNEKPSSLLKHIYNEDIPSQLTKSRIGKLWNRITNKRRLPFSELGN